MTREQALEYARILWRRMSLSGEGKEAAIRNLIAEGKLPEAANHWPHYCSLCALDTYNCGECPWPADENGDKDMQCVEVPSPFRDWQSLDMTHHGQRDRLAVKRQSKKVYDLVCTMT